MTSGNNRRSVRHAMRLANANALIWAIGNGLVSTTLITYLAMELGAKGIAVSFILAAPRLVGLLRLATPMLLAQGAQRKTVCLVGYFASSVVLWFLPWIAAPRVDGSYAGSIAGLVGCWCLYHLLEYIATLSFWSWFGDWMPTKLRGRLIGWRESHLMIGRIVGIAASVLLDQVWKIRDPAAERWEPYAWSALIGAAVMTLAVIPLWLLPALAHRPNAHPRAPWSAMGRAFTDIKYRRLIIYSAWFGIANGITSTAQLLYPQRILNIGYTPMVGMRAMMHGGQSWLAPLAGGWIDRWGARRLMIVAQLIVATGPLFHLFSTPAQPWWIVGAFVVWIAYAPLNVGLDSLKLKLAPPDNNLPCLAAYHATGDLASGAAIIAAGAAYDVLYVGGAPALQLYAVLFVTGWLFRTSAAVLVARIRE